MSRNYFILVGKSLHFPETEKKEEDSKDLSQRDETSCTDSKTFSKSDSPPIKIDPRHKIKLTYFLDFNKPHNLNYPSIHLL